MQETSPEIAWPIYIISLRSAARRRAQCAETMQRLGLHFEFFDALEGASLPDDEIALVYDAGKNARVYKHPLSRPEMGCSLSHYALWQRIAAAAAGGAFLLEDDFQAEPGLLEVINGLSRANLENCMIKLYAHRPAPGEPVGALPRGHRLILPKHVPGLTLGYAIDRVAAARMAARLLPMGRPVDMDIKHWWEFDVPVLVVEPNVLRVEKAQTGSTIDAARAETHAGALRRAWRNLRYQLAYNIGVVRHRSREREHLQRLRAILESGPGQ